MPKEIHASSEYQKDKHFFDLSGKSSLQKGHDIIDKLIEETGLHEGEKQKRIRDDWNDYIDKSRILVFDDNEIDDFKRLIIFHSHILPDNLGLENIFIGIKKDRKLVTGYITNHGNSKAIFNELTKLKLYEKDKIERYLHITSEDILYNNFFSIGSRFYPLLLHRIYESLNYLFDLNNINTSIFFQSIKFASLDKIEQTQKLIMESMGKDIIKIMNDANMTKMHHVKWLTGGDDLDISKDVIQARQQVVKAYPILANQICEDLKIRDAVDEKKPLLPLLAKKYNVSKKRFKRIHEIPYSFGMRSCLVDILEMPDRAFSNGRDHIKDIGLFFRYAYDVYHENKITPLLNRLSQNGNPWRYIDRMKEHSSLDVRDALVFLRNKFFIPCLLQRIKHVAERKNMIWSLDDMGRGNSSDIYFFLLNRFTMKNLLDLSERYHANIARYDDILCDDTGFISIKWEGLIGDIDLGNGYIAKELNSVASLKRQGQEEDHCVGGYANQILDGTNSQGEAKIIFSMEKNGQIESTIDIICKKNSKKTGLKAYIRQHKSKGNESVSDELSHQGKVLIEKISMIHPRQFDDYVKNIYTVKREYEKNSPINMFVSLSGFNPWNYEMLRRVWDEIHMVLPKNLRHLGLDGIIESMPIENEVFLPNENGDKINIWDKIKEEDTQNIYLEV